jgi:hypothetical protein
MLVDEARLSGKRTGLIRKYDTGGTGGSDHEKKLFGWMGSVINNDI